MPSYLKHNPLVSHNSLTVTSYTASRKSPLQRRKERKVASSACYWNRSLEGGKVVANRRPSPPPGQTFPRVTRAQSGAGAGTPGLLLAKVFISEMEQGTEKWETATSLLSLCFLGTAEAYGAVRSHRTQQSSFIFSGPYLCFWLDIRWNWLNLCSPPKITLPLSYTLKHRQICKHGTGLDLDHLTLSVIGLRSSKSLISLPEDERTALSSGVHCIVWNLKIP